jgi:hypothetical protein
MKNSRFYAAIDGTHVPIRVSVPEINVYINRKGHISTNVLIMCNFNARILLCFPGVEGSAHDSFFLEKSGLIEIIIALPAINLF